MKSVILRAVAVVLAGWLFSAACGDEDGNGGDGGDGGGDEPFELVVTPEFVQGIVPGEVIPVLVSVTGTAGAGEVRLSAAFPAGEVTVEPERIAPGQIAEVILVADPVTQDVPSDLMITAMRGSIERTVTRNVVAMPFEDDRGEMAADVLGIFTAWLAQEHPDLGITPGSQFESQMVAPGLLVVSHYMFANEAYELGVSWHVMIAPDDWAELYLRPRGDLHPTRAFRVSSWSAALAGDQVEFTEVAPPEEVVR